MNRSSIIRISTACIVLLGLLGVRWAYMVDDRLLMARFLVIMAVAFPFFFVPDVLGVRSHDSPAAHTQKALWKLALAAVAVCALVSLFFVPVSGLLENAAGLLGSGLAIRPAD